MKPAGLLVGCIVFTVTFIATAMAQTPVPPVSPTPTPLPWPMFGCDAAHTSRSPVGGVLLPVLDWSYLTGGPVGSSPAVSAPPKPMPASNTVYIGSGDGVIHTIGSDGDLEWSYETDGAVLSSPAIGDDGKIYAGSQDDRVYAFESDGSVAWTYVTGGDVNSSPVLNDDGSVYIGALDNFLYAFKSDGALRWRFETGGSGVWASPAITNAGSPAAASFDGRLCVIQQWSYSTSWSYRVLWTYKIGTVGAGSSAAVDNDRQRFYVGSDDLNVYAFDSVGGLDWSYRTGDEVQSSPAIGDDGTVYVGSDDYRIYALDSDGELTWSYRTGDRIASSPAIDAGGRVYVGSDDRALYSFDSDGSFSWSYVAEGKVASSPSIGLDQRLYFGSEAVATPADMGVIYALRSAPTPTPTPPPTATPTAANYVELDVLDNSIGNPDEFYYEDQVVLQWDVYPDEYLFDCSDADGIADGARVDVYLGARQNPPFSEGGTTTVELVTQDIATSSELYLFDERLQAVKYDPDDLRPTYRYVCFPLGGDPDRNDGTLVFTAPERAVGRWVFVSAFTFSDTGQAVATPAVEVSNGFTLNPEETATPAPTATP